MSTPAHEAVQRPDLSAPAPAPTLSDSIAFLGRRKWIFLGFALPVIAGSIVLAFVLPAVYLSEATILIEQQTIPENIVGSGVQSYVDEQIQVVTQRVLSRENMRSLVEDFNLYADSSANSSGRATAAAIREFRENTVLETIETAVFDPTRGRPGELTYGFTIGYHYSDPEIAQAVTDKLAELYLSENVRLRTERAAGTTRFLEREAERLSEEISAREQELAKFKGRYGDAMPEQLILNMQALDRAERELEDMRQETIDLRGQRDLLRSELATTDPHATIYSEGGAPVLSSANRLEELRRQYAQLLSRYGPEHPDVMRARRELSSLSSSGQATAGPALEQQIAALETELAGLRDRNYSDDHPDVRRIERAIEVLREEQAAPVSPAPADRAPDNPDYIKLQVQLESVTQSVAAAEARQQDLENRRTELERRLAMAPRVEQELLSLNRDYENLLRQFDEIKRRTTDARLSERLEEENQGDRFSLLNSASLPDQPVEPNRAAIIFLGIVLALGGGLGLAVLFDAMDDTVRGVRDILAITGVRPVAMIPYVRAHEQRFGVILKIFAALLVLAAMAGLTFVFYYN